MCLTWVHPVFCGGDNFSQKRLHFDILPDFSQNSVHEIKLDCQSQFLGNICCDKVFYLNFESLKNIIEETWILLRVKRRYKSKCVFQCKDLFWHETHHGASLYLFMINLVYTVLLITTKNSLQNEVIYMREFLTIQIANWKMKYQWKILTKFVCYMSGYIKIFPENNLTL